MGVGGEGGGGRWEEAKHLLNRSRYRPKFMTILAPWARLTILALQIIIVVDISDSLQLYVLSPLVSTITLVKKQLHNLSQSGFKRHVRFANI